MLLDGQGADEVLGGYKKYSHWYLQQLLRSRTGTFLKEKKLLQQHHLLEQWSLKNYAAAFLPGYTANKLSARAIDQQQRYPFLNRDFYSNFNDPVDMQKPTITSLESLLYYNSFVFGLEELLRYADRNSMALSREVRLPFLFHELVEFVFSLPSNYKIRNGFTKWILRQAVKEMLPANIVWRTGKIGFVPPQKEWLKQPVIKENIMDSKRKLVNACVLNNSVMHHPEMVSAAHDNANSDRRFMNAAAIINSSSAPAG